MTSGFEASSCATERSFAPIAVFAFNRPRHIQRTLDALAQCLEFKKSPLFIFCDGPRSEDEAATVATVRDVVRSFPHPTKTIIEGSQNRGLARSIVEGVTRLCQEFERVIVVEDDLIVSPLFLEYMNAALDRYADTPQVMQVSGHMFPVNLHTATDAVFLPFTTSWGWATWLRAWNQMKETPEAAFARLGSWRWRFEFDVGGAYPYSRMLGERLRGRNSSWAIWWYFQVFQRSGLVLFPRTSLVNNDGFDGSGTHCSDVRVDWVEFNKNSVASFPAPHIDRGAYRAVRHFLLKDRGLVRGAYDALWRLLYLRSKE